MLPSADQRIAERGAKRWSPLETVTFTRRFMAGPEVLPLSQPGIPCHSPERRCGSDLRPCGPGRRERSQLAGDAGTVGTSQAACRLRFASKLAPTGACAVRIAALNAAH